MQPSQLDDTFNVTQYQLTEQRAEIRLVGGDVVIRAPYAFFNASGQQRGPVVNLRMVVTQEQSDNLRSILVNILQATNAAIELETGWIKYTEG